MWLLIFLAVCAYMDLKTGYLPAWLLTFASVGVGIYRICNWQGHTALWLGGVGIGIAFLLFSRWTEESLGYGDSWLILLLGGAIGFWNLLWLLSIAFALSGVVSLFLLTVRKCSKTTAFPFVPLLAVSYAGVMYL